MLWTASGALFFASRRRQTRWPRDWSSDVCSSDLDEAFAVADRIAIMSVGKILQIGTPQEVWRNPGTEQVAKFLGYRWFRSEERRVGKECGWGAYAEQCASAGVGGGARASRWRHTT